jgi:hypothetical protein
MRDQLMSWWSRLAGIYDLTLAQDAILALEGEEVQPKLALLRATNAGERAAGCLSENQWADGVGSRFRATVFKWRVLARKRLPTPSALRTIKANATLIVLSGARTAGGFVSGLRRPAAGGIV